MKKWQDVSKKDSLKEDASGKWKDIKKKAIPFLQQFRKCEVDYKEYGKSNLKIEKVQFSFKNIFSAYLKEGKFNFIPKDDMSAILFTDDAKGLKLYDNSFEFYIMVD